MIAMEIRRHRARRRLWCFKCRARLRGYHVLRNLPSSEWLGPVWLYRCDGCGEDHRRFGS